MSRHHDGGVADGWIAMPPGWVHHARRVITRNALEEALYWFPIPDPNGYAGIGLALMDKTPGAREYWIWTDESGDRTARIVRLGYRRYVVELHAEDVFAVIEDPRRDAREQHVTAEERDVLGHNAVSPARTLSSSVVAESCASVWINHGYVHDGMRLGRWSDQ